MSEGARPGSRGPGELRPVQLELEAAPFAEGSCLISMGRTRVLCAATVEGRVPPWREGSGGGWVTGEYSMLPRSTKERTRRERSGARGRTREIERLIGRALRAATDLDGMGERTLIVDCDVLTADGGTRTAAITGGCVALFRAFATLVEAGELGQNPVSMLVAAVSVGIVDGEPRLDLEYVEDVAASVDMNVAALEENRLVEVQGTAEGTPFDRQELDALLDLADRGIGELFRLQRQALDS